MSIIIRDRLVQEILDNMRFLCTFETATTERHSLREVEIVYYTNEVKELNEKYGLNLKCIEDYEHSPSQFSEGSWFISHDGYFVHFI
jgi:hypothetical protein